MVRFFDGGDAFSFSLKRTKNDTSAEPATEVGHRGILSRVALPQLLGAKKQREYRREVSEIREIRKKFREAAAFSPRHEIFSRELSPFLFHAFVRNFFNRRIFCNVQRAVASTRWTSAVARGG